MDGAQGNPFDTEDAISDGYENLEQRCFQEDIDYENATNSSIRLRGWQRVAINTVKNRSGTNQVQVIYHAYMEGLSRLRDVVERERIKELSEIRQMMVDMFTDYDHFSYSMNELIDEILGEGIQDPLTHHGDSTEHYSCYFKNSARSEIKDTFEADANFGGWIHRAIISIGLGASESIGSELQNRVEEVESAVSGMYDKARTKVETLLNNTLTDSYEYWLENGIYEGQIEPLEEIVDMMTTRHKRAVELTINDLRKNAEIIEG